ncbi:MAG: hypothetical protein PF482_03530, partial [Desulfobacteraceae bacterium]|nr:hypothetical protein [Desulfobacteraceae bacterium]
GLSFPNVSIGNPVMCYSEHRFRLKACRNDIVLAETMIKAEIYVSVMHFKSKTLKNRNDRIIRFLRASRFDDIEKVTNLNFAALR